MKLTFLPGLLLTALSGFAQTDQNVFLQTTHYSGTYSFGTDIEKEAVGRAIVYPETDSTILFFIDICKGAGSASIGQLYGRLIIKDGQGIYFSKRTSEKKGCKWKMVIDKNILSIKTLNDCNECGLGHSISADNQYKRKFEGIPSYFTDMEGRKVYFDKTPPENYSR
jgi:hypothetical protein